MRLSGWHASPPIIWMPGALSARSANLLVETNPVYHLLQIVRAPILGSSPTVMNWTVSVLVALLGSAIALWFFGKYKKRIAYWL